MNICILSMQKVNNYGSVLQSYCLRKMLIELGHEVHFIDIEPNDQQFYMITNYDDKTFQEEEKHSKNSLTRKLSKIDKYFFNRINNRIRYSTQVRIFDEFRVKNLGISKKDNSDHYDICVIGSDEMFNCMQKSPWGFTSQMFGDVAQADKKITYAVSCGNTKYEDVPLDVKNIISKALNNLSGISVRDLNTYNFVKKLCDKRIYTHYDPVVVCNLDKEISAAHIKQRSFDKRYCLVYSYPDRIHDMNYIQQIKEFAKRHKLIIVTAGYGQGWISNYINADPFTLLTLFSQASFVITDTFHGTIFAMKYSKRFAIKIQDSNRNKLGDLICKFELDDHVTEDFEDLESIYNTKKDEKSILNKCNAARIETNEYLNDLINS